jgi:hypothetical protein
MRIVVLTTIDINYYNTNILYNSYHEKLDMIASIL